MFKFILVLLIAAFTAPVFAQWVPPIPPGCVTTKLPIFGLVCKPLQCLKNPDGTPVLNPDGTPKCSKTLVCCPLP